VGRPPLAVGTHGSISVKRSSTGSFRASTRVRDRDGATRQVEAWGGSAAAATRALKLAVRDRARSAGDDDITPDTRVSALAEAWFAELESEGRIRPQSRQMYRATWRIIEPAMGDLRIREVTVSGVERVVKEVLTRTPGRVKHVRVVLDGVLGLAVRHDAATHNAVRSISRTPIRPRASVVVIDLDDIAAIRSAVRSFRQGPRDDGKAPRMGPKENCDLADIVELMLATGARISEVLALRWEDIHLDAQAPTVTIAGTLVEYKGQPNSRQNLPKTSAGFRTLILPAFAVEVLRRRQLEQAANPNRLDAVFVSRVGTWLSHRNVSTKWRAVRAEGELGIVTWPQFRKTVATLVSQEAGNRAVAAQLGHASERVGETFYIKRAHEAPDLTAALDTLAPRAS
jgi:integrase